MRLRSQVGSLHRQVVASAYQRLIALGEQGPIVSFSFDDFPRSALTAGANVLEDYGVRGTYYAAMSLMNTTNKLGEQFREGDVRILWERGHEVASHTFSHQSARHTEFARFRCDVEHGERALCDALGGPLSRNFAYPYGEVTLTAKKNLGPEMLSSRGACGGLNGPKVDLNLLRANALYGDVDRAAAAKELISENEDRRTWLIFYTHDVTGRPSPYGCTSKLLEMVCSFACARKGRIMTVAQVMAMLGQKQKSKFSRELDPNLNEQLSVTNA